MHALAHAWACRYTGKAVPLKPPNETCETLGRMLLVNGQLLEYSLAQLLATMANKVSIELPNLAAFELVQQMQQVCWLLCPCVGVPLCLRVPVLV